MRAYSAKSMEAIRARDALKDWAGEGFITEAQRKQIEQESPCELRRTNIFLRAVLFFFTVLIVAAAVGLFFVLFLEHSDTSTIGFLLLFASFGTYAAAEFTVSQGKLYRYGIEEALAGLSVAFLCLGIELTFFRLQNYSPQPKRFECVVPVAGIALSLWIWYRFLLPYAPLAAMIFVFWIPGFWTTSQTDRHIIVAAIYAVGLFIVIRVRGRDRLTYLNHIYSIAEALGWLGIYVDAEPAVLVVEHPWPVARHFAQPC